MATWRRTAPRRRRRFQNERVLFGLMCNFLCFSTICDYSVLNKVSVDFHAVNTCRIAVGPDVTVRARGTKFKSFFSQAAVKVAPFKFRLSRMSKSNPSTRSNSVENPENCESELGSPQTNVPAILETAEGQDAVPSSPPPSYDFVLEETRLQAQAGGSTPTKGPEILHKSSKELYRAVAKQFGITCKMSDQCRCLDCQSHYFDCEYEQNEQEKTDGGLGAGTPMFISEVMHGTACSIL